MIISHCAPSRYSRVKNALNMVTMASQRYSGCIGCIGSMSGLPDRPVIWGCARGLRVRPGGPGGIRAGQIARRLTPCPKEEVCGTIDGRTDSRLQWPRQRIRRAEHRYSGGTERQRQKPLRQGWPTAHPASPIMQKAGPPQQHPVSLRRSPASQRVRFQAPGAHAGT